MKTLQTLGNLMIDNKDLADSYNWDEAQKQIELLNSQNYKDFNDWRLPTKKELNLMYLNKEDISGFANVYYWSSSKYGDNYAWIQGFGNGCQDNANKSFTAYIRAVRTI